MSGWGFKGLFGSRSLRDSSSISSIVGNISAHADGAEAEIARLVQNRVKERDSWTPQVRRTQLEEFEMVRKNLIKDFIRMRIPSQAELDRDFPVKSIDWNVAKEPPPDQIQVTWLGHSSLLLQMNGFNLLTDPVFSKRCSPTQWLGPARYRPPPCSIQELCEQVQIDAVLISHNHYDHLDYLTVRDLTRLGHNPEFVLPLGLKKWFIDYVSVETTYHELDWHETVTVGDTLDITSVPMRHWSNRVGDRDKTLWCGYSVCTNISRSLEHRKKFLFPGDTAWYDQLSSEIGDRYGPFDLAAIPIGAYEPRDFMKIHHINVEEAVLMKDAIQAKAAVPIHWGTFPLTTEPVLEPREKLLELMKGRADAESFVPWLIGETKRTE